MNTKLIESLVQIILALYKKSDSFGGAALTLLEEKLFGDASFASTHDLMQLAQSGGAFNFLHDEPELYMLED